MPLLNDLLDFNENPLMPPSAQLFAEHLPIEWLQHCLSLSSHAPSDAAAYQGIWSFGWWSAWRFSAMSPSPRLFVASI